MTTEHYEQEIQRLSKSGAPATMGMIAQLSDVFIKNLREKLRQRDQRILALEGRVENLEQQLAAFQKFLTEGLA